VPRTRRVTERTKDLADPGAAADVGAVSGQSRQAYFAAATFVEALGTLAWHARHEQPGAGRPDGWKDLGRTFAEAFVAWHDLSRLLTPSVRAAARRAYGPGQPSIKLGRADAKPTMIEAVADELGVYIRNIMYPGRPTPFEPDPALVIERAKMASPFGWGRLVRELLEAERLAVRQRLGIRTWEDALGLMTREWESQDPRWGSPLPLYRCGSIDFADLAVQLDREARAVLSPIDSIQGGETADIQQQLAQLRAEVAMLAERGSTETPRASTVVLWEGAAHTDHNVRLARTRSAYLEAGGNVREALAALRSDGFAIGQSTFYDHLRELDKESPGWRDQVLRNSGLSGKMERAGTAGLRQRHRGIPGSA